MNKGKTLFGIFRFLGSIANKLQLFRSSFISRMYSHAYHHLRPYGIYKIRVNGYHLYVDSSDTGLVPSFLRNNFEKNETELFKRLVKPNMVVVDMGANIGYYTLLASKLVGKKGRVYAFEPETKNYALLVKNIKSNKCKNIVAIQKALSDRSRTETLFLSPNNLGSHRMYKFKGSIRNVPIKSIKFDDFFKDIKKIDLIKIDIEGNEPRCLHGMKRTIKKSDKLAMIIEFNPKMIKENGFNPIAFLNEIKGMGFRLYEIRKYGKLSEIVKYDISDVIAKDRYINIYCKKGRN